MPAWSQFYPGATSTSRSTAGRCTRRRRDQFDDYIYAALTNFMHVRAARRHAAGWADARRRVPVRHRRQARSSAVARRRRRQPVARSGPLPGPVDPVGRRTLPPDLSGRRQPRALPRRLPSAVGIAAPRPQCRADSHADGWQPGRLRRSGTPIWASGTVGFGGAWLLVQSDGNLVIYSAAWAPVWASGTQGG